MKKALLITLFAVTCGSLVAQAQGGGTPTGGMQCYINGQYVFVASGGCPASGGGGGGGSSPGYSGLSGAAFQLGNAFGRWLFGGGGSNTNAADEALRQQQEQLRQQQEQLMMAEVRRREEEAVRLHQEEEARRLAAMYNRLASTLKLSGLPHLELKTSGIPAGGLHLKMGDNADGHVGIKGLPGMYLNDGATPYGIPGLPGIYTGGPGTGSALPPPTQPGLQLKMGDAAAAPTAPAAGASVTPDFNKMTPQQLADAADAFSKLPTEEQQRAMAAGQNGPAAPQQVPTPPAKASTAEQMNDAPASQPAQASTSVMTPQTAAQPIASLQQQANASQAAAAAPTLEDASAKARAGFDTSLGPGPVQIGTTTAPAAIQPPAAAVAVAPAPVPPPSPTATPAPPPVANDWVKQYLFPANQPSSPFPSDPNPPLNNPLREEQKQQAELKAWDDWAIQRATHIHDSHTEPGQIAYPQGMVQAGLNRSAVQQYAPELLNRYNTDSAFRQSVDQRLQYTDEHVALAYYQGLAEAHKAAILEFHAELDQLTAAGKLDRLTPLDEQYRLHPERRQLVQSAWDRASTDEQAALAKAQAEGNATVDKEYQFVFQLIRGDAAQQR